MKLERVKVANYVKETVCKYNAACRCTVKNCYYCGWNPKVARYRLNKLLGKGEWR